jgi:hypothetical protein
MKQVFMLHYQIKNLRLGLRRQEKYVSIAIGGADQGGHRLEEVFREDRRDGWRHGLADYVM